MTRPIDIRYELHEAGWATATVVSGTSVIEAPVSYLRDSLADLAGAARRILRGEPAAVVLMDEPGEHHIVLYPAEGGQVHVAVRWFEDWVRDWRDCKPDQYRTLLEAEDSAVAFARRIVMVLDGILEKHGVEGYRAKWHMHPFPEGELRELKNDLQGRIRT